MAEGNWGLGRQLFATDRDDTSSRASRRKFRPTCEALDRIQLLSGATLAPIGPVAALSGTGYQVVLDGGTENQVYTVSSSNAGVGATIAQGNFLTIGVSHAAANANDVSFSGNLVFQLFQDLTPLTVSRIEELVQNGFYTSPTTGNDPATGRPYPTKIWHRVEGGFPGPNDFIVQGGSPAGNGTGSVGLPGFPFSNEIVPQLQFNGKYQLAMANANQAGSTNTNTNESQFFVTTSSPTALDDRYTIFGQLLEGEEIVEKMTEVARSGSAPVSPIFFTSTTLSTANPDGVVHVDTTQATPGTTSDLLVTARSLVDGSTTTQSFKVYVAGNTNSVRVIGTTMIVNPPARRGKNVRNVVNVGEVDGTLRVYVNGILDTNQPSSSGIDSLVVFGTKASDRITVDPNVLIPATLDGGHGGTNRLMAGGGSSILHGWFGSNVLKGGNQQDLLVGRQGRVQFRKSRGKDVLYVGDPRLNLTYKNHTPQPAKGRFYHFQGSRIVPGLPT